MKSQEFSVPHRIALFIPSLHGGGAERVMVNISKGLIKRGFRVDIVLSKARGPYMSEIPKSARVIDLNEEKIIYSLPGLISYLKTETPDLLVSTVTRANIIAIWAKLLSGFPNKVIVREVNTLSVHTNYTTNVKVKMLPYLVRFFYPKADWIVVNSNGVASDLKKFVSIPPKKIKVIPNPVDVDDIELKANEPLNHSWFNRYPVILGVGRLKKQKDFSTLIRSFSIIRKKKHVN